jgi:hypothetical protein
MFRTQLPPDSLLQLKLRPLESCTSTCHSRPSGSSSSFAQNLSSYRFPRQNFRPLRALLPRRGSRSLSPLPVPKSLKPTSTFSPPRSATAIPGNLTRGLAGSFFYLLVAHGLELTTVRPFHVAAWIEDFPGSKPTVKQKLAAVRRSCSRHDPSTLEGSCDPILTKADGN